MNFLLIILSFLSWRTLDNWIIYFAEQFVPYLGFFPYPHELFDYGVSHVTSALANFDGIHYATIAHRGNYEQWEQAYFPLYSFLIRVIDPIFNNELITGILISNISFLIGIFVLFKLFKSERINIRFWLLFFILLFPTSFFFGAVYTEGLFFLLFISSLYFLKKEKYWLVFFFSILTSLTRLIGVFLIIPIAFHLFEKHKKTKSNNKNLLLNIKNILLAAPFLGLGIYCFYLFKTTGDPFMFLTSQPVFGANRSTSIILLPQVVWRYLKIFFTASHNYQYFVSLYEFIVFFLVFFVLILDFFKYVRIDNLIKFKIKIIDYELLGLNLFSFANIILPTLTGTFSSIPRYALFSISFFIFLSKIKNGLVKSLILIAFIILHIITLGLFGQGYFIG